MRKVVLIFTGGTIGMTLTDKAQGIVSTVTAENLVSELLRHTPCDNLVIHEFSDVPSPSMTLDSMRALADICERYLSSDDHDGIVIVHGTDTLEETAFYLDVVLSSDKPVILTGSMKNASELGFDGLTNLASGIRVAMAREARKKGVLVLMNYAIHAASEVTKTHTLNVDTFKSFEFGPLGTVDGDDVIFFRKQARRKRFGLQNIFAESVHLLKVYAGMDGSLIDCAVAANAKAIIFEALGRGNVPPMMMPSIRDAVARGVVVVIVSRCWAGRVLDSYGYEGGGKDLARSGCLFGQYVSGPKARILIAVALGNGLSTKDMRRLLA